MSIAAFRKSRDYDELNKLAEEHYQHDLEEGDREVLKNAVKKISTPAVIGSLVGLGLGVYVAFRLRKARLDIFHAFRAAEKPTQVIFANGRTEAVPDITPMLRPTKFGDVATYLLCGLGGLFLGGETGFLTGSSLAARSIRKDPARQKRIENAYRKFKADYLRKEADRLEAGGTPWDANV